MNKILFSILALILFQNCIATKRSNFEFSKLLWAADWSPDDKLIAVGGNQDELQILQADNLEVVKSYSLSNTITKIAWHPDGELLAITKQWNDEGPSKEAQTRIININSDEIMQLDQIGARGLAWSPGGEYLAVGGLEGVLSIFSKDGTLLKRMPTNQKAIIGLSWHPHKNIIATVGSQIELVDIDQETHQEIRPRDQEILMLCVAWHQSGDYFVTGDYGNPDINYPPLLQLWDASGKKIRDLEGSKTEYRNLRWSPDGAFFASTSDQLRIWSNEGKMLKSRALGSLLWGLDWSSNGEQLVVTSENGTVAVLDNELKKIDQLKNK